MILIVNNTTVITTESTATTSSSSSMTIPYLPQTIKLKGHYSQLQLNAIATAI